MNYASLTTDELISMAQTDQDAKRYIMENAEVLLDQFKELEDEMMFGAVDDAYREGQSDGAHNATCHFRNKYRDRIGNALLDLDEGSVARKLLKEIYDELSI